MQKTTQHNANDAILARRLARELAVEEIVEVSGGTTTDWSVDYKDGSSTGRTGVRLDGRVDF
ncbi:MULTISPECIES: hypothetical protein [unclassified Duganella]|uniref:hypothetical protein n=1 Tax=unclassified Duganella TaxID=2636909 RepID=UPI000892FCC4|nr:MULTISPECIES: hypothetical protein [unclassified Duganella]OEZ60024.1 hypothetical protein DUGA6_32490 [Duganella sp. HH105]OFA01493.1 hypothetical protein DUGA2_42280 [Duganella sp. HH101]